MLIEFVFMVSQLFFISFRLYTQEKQKA